MYSPVTSTARPNAISVAPNGRANGATATSPPDEPVVLVLTETRNSCTRATAHESRDFFNKKKNKVEDVPTPADAKERLVRTYARNVRSDARWSRATEPVFCSVSERPNGRAAGAGETSSSSSSALCWAGIVGGAEGPSRGGSSSEIAGLSRDLDGDKGERRGGLGSFV